MRNDFENDNHETFDGDFSYEPVSIATEPVLLTAEQVAARLAVTTRTLTRWRADGTGPVFVKLSRAVVRYRSSDVDDFVEARLSRYSD